MPGKYTLGEMLGIAGHTIRGARRVAASGSEDEDGGYGARADRIHDKAQARFDRRAQLAFSELEAAENELDRAEQALHMARGPEKAAARKRRNDAKAKVRRADAVARRFS